MPLSVFPRWRLVFLWSINAMSMAHHAKETEVSDPTARKAAFAQVISAGCRCLILGSLPGDPSLKAGEYYAHPRNIFWDLVAHFLAIDRDLPMQRGLSN